MHMKLSALASPTRMRVLSLLIESRNGVSSGDIAEALGIPRNLMSSHLVLLRRAGIISSSKSGRSVIYQAVGESVVQLADHLRGLVPASSGD